MAMAAAGFLVVGTPLAASGVAKRAFECADHRVIMASLPIRIAGKSTSSSNTIDTPERASTHAGRGKRRPYGGVDRPLSERKGAFDIDKDWLLEASDSEEAAELTARLISIRSYPGEENAVQEVIAGCLIEQGIAVERQELSDGRFNLIATVKNGNGPTLQLNGHVDTVLAAQEWSSDPWTPRIDGDCMYGLGASYMKSGDAGIGSTAQPVERDSHSDDHR